MAEQSDPARGGEERRAPAAEVPNPLVVGAETVEARQAAILASDALDALTESLNTPAVLDAAVVGFCARIAELERVTEDGSSINVYGHARVIAGTALLVAGRVDDAATVVATTTDSMALHEVLTALEIRGAALGVVERVRELAAGVVAKLEAIAPDKLEAILRHVRDRALSKRDPQLLPIFEKYDTELAQRIGPDYDAVADWIAYETAAHPYADWSAIATLVRDDSLWAAGTPYYTRQAAAQDAGQSVSDIMSSEGFRRGFNKGVQALLSQMRDAIASTPAEGYLHGMIALALYRKGAAPEARLIVRELQMPETTAYVAEGLLRLGASHVAEAQRLILGLTSYRVMVDMLLDGSWPDRAVPDALLSEITVLQTKRSNSGRGPIVSQHPVPMRVACLEALAARYQEEGDTERAGEMLRRARQLEWQLANNVIKHMPRKER